MEPVSAPREGPQGQRAVGPAPRPALAALAQMPTLEVLNGLPIPVLAVSRSGTILFANAAFADMVGRPSDVVEAMQYSDVFHTAPATDSAVSFMHAFDGLIVELSHSDGSVVAARMSKSALLRSDDPVALAAFQDLTEKMWSIGY